MAVLAIKNGEKVEQFRQQQNACDFYKINYSIYELFYSPSGSTVSEDAGIKPRTVATLALTARRSNHSATTEVSTKYPAKFENISYLLRSYNF